MVERLRFICLRRSNSAWRKEEQPVRPDVAARISLDRNARAGGGKRIPASFASRIVRRCLAAGAAPVRGHGLDA